VAIKNAASGPISFTEIKAYSDIYGELDAFEVDVIRVLDGMHESEAAKNG